MFQRTFLFAHLVSDVERVSEGLDAHGEGALGEVEPLQHLPDPAVGHGDGPVLAGRYQLQQIKINALMICYCKTINTEK
jgi:hypothetical protein